jgi:hypothetical protein
MLLSTLDYTLGNESWMENDCHSFGTLYYGDIFKSVKFLMAHLPFQAHLNAELVCHAESESCGIHTKMNTGAWWWNTQDELAAGAMIVQVIGASDKNNLTKFSGDQHA